MSKCPPLNLRVRGTPPACSVSLDYVRLCSGIDLGPNDYDQFLSLWSQPGNPCLAVATCPLTNNEDQTKDFTRPYANLTYVTYTKTFGKKITGNTNDPQYDPFQNYILDLCREAPGACDEFLCSVCNPDDVSDSRQYVSSNQILLDFCGCMVPPDPLVPDGFPECDPLCSRYGTVKRRNDKGGALNCEQDVCTISNVTIEASGQNRTKVDVSQVCSNCRSSVCQCILSDINSNQVVNYNQSCGSNSICYNIDKATNTRTVVKCGDGSDGGSQFNYTLLIIFLVILIIVIIVIIGAISYYMRSKSKNTVS